MSVTKTVKNPKDIEDLLVSLDLAIKQLATEELTPEERVKLTPIIMFGNNASFYYPYNTHEGSKDYIRPMINFSIDKRTPASLSGNSFFEGPHQHGPHFGHDTENGKVEFLMRDNQIKLTVKAKTKREIIFLMHFLERVFLFKKHVLNCLVSQFVNSDEYDYTEGELYKCKILFNARTKMIIETIDTDVLTETIITYNTPVCSHFNLETYKCDKIDAEKYTVGNDFECYNTTYCKDYYPKYVVAQIKT